MTDHPRDQRHTTARAYAVEALMVYARELQDTLVAWGGMPDDFLHGLAEDYASSALASSVTADSLRVLAEALRATARSVQDFIGQHWP